MPKPLIIAAQMPEASAAALVDGVDGVVIRSIPPGFAAPLDSDLDVLVATPGKFEGQLKHPLPASLKWVHLLSSGMDNYPDWLLRFPRVTTSKGANASAVAEFVLALILAHAKSLPEAWVHRAEHWKVRRLQSLAGSTLGILGMGAIGTAVATRALAFQMRVLGLRKSAGPMPLGADNAGSLEDLFARSDHLVLALPAQAGAPPLIDRQVLSNSRPGLHLINVARGALLDDAALLNALNSGLVAAASLDVAQHEPPPPDHPFYSHPRIRLSPHIASVTDRLMADLNQTFAREIARFRAGQGAQIRDRSGTVC